MLTRIKTYLAGVETKYLISIPLAAVIVMFFVVDIIVSMPKDAQYNDKPTWSNVLKESPSDIKKSQERFRNALKDLESRSKK